MAKVSQSNSSKQRKMRPALTPEGRENQLVYLAYEVAEEQLLNRTASSQVITHFLKMGTAQAELEKEKLRKENILLTAKTEALQSAKRTEELFGEAIKAFKSYQGSGDVTDDEDY